MQKPKKENTGSRKARATAARMAAVQAVYQMKANDQNAKAVIDEYRLHRLGKPVDGMQMVLPDGTLFCNLVEGVFNDNSKLEDLIIAALQKQERYRNAPSDATSSVPEQLLYAILKCGAYELLTHADIDAPIIISDYLHVTHAFYDDGEAKMVNAVLDAVNKAVRA